MKHAIEQLDKIVYEKFNPNNALNHTPDSKLIIVLTAEIDEELAKVRRILLRCSVDSMSERAFELLIQQCQAGIIDLLDKVYEYKEVYPDHWLQPVYERSIGLLGGTLTQIERKYTKYFSLDASVPELYLKVMQQETGEQLKLLKHSSKFKGLDPDLIKIATDPLFLFSKDKWGKPITYYRMLYIKMLVGELIDISNMKQQYTDKELIMLLVYVNFNTPEMIRCITLNIVNEVNRFKDAEAQEECLEQWLKELNQCLVKPGVKIIKKQVQLKIQLISWVKEELQYFEKQQRLFVEPKRSNAAKSDMSSAILNINLPVQCVGILIRSAAEEGLLIDSVEGAIEKASKIFRTPGTKNSNGLSSESMRIKSYSPSKQEKARVVQPLYEMIKRINKY